MAQGAVEQFKEAVRRQGAPPRGLMDRPPPREGWRRARQDGRAALQELGDEGEGLRGVHPGGVVLSGAVVVGDEGVDPDDDIGVVEEDRPTRVAEAGAALAAAGVAR